MSAAPVSGRRSFFSLRQIFDTGTITDPITGVSIEVDEVFEGIY